MRGTSSEVKLPSRCSVVTRPKATMKAIFCQRHREMLTWTPGPPAGGATAAASVLSGNLTKIDFCTKSKYSHFLVLQQI